MMSTKNVEGIRVVTFDNWNGVSRFLYIRDIGVKLGFGSNGGNLSRYVRTRWKRVLYYPKHYVIGRHKAILINADGVAILMRLLRNPKYNWPRRCTPANQARVLSLAMRRR